MNLMPRQLGNAVRRHHRAREFYLVRFPGEDSIWLLGRWIWPFDEVLAIAVVRRPPT